MEWSLSEKLSVGVLAILILLALSSNQLWSGTTSRSIASTNSPEHSGYISNVQAEKKSEANNESFFVVWDIEVPKEKRLEDSIFTDKLKKEFKSRYERQFGRTEAEQNLEFFSPNDYFFDRDGVVVTSSKVRRKERAFGEYMLRRLAEFHLDHKMKNDPQARKVYQLKERVRKSEVSIAKGYKVKSQYRIASNSLELEFDNPYVDSKVETDLNDWTTTEEMANYLIFSAWRNITKTVRMSAYYRTESGQVNLVTRKQFTRQLSADLNVTPNKSAGDDTEVFGLLGAKYGF